MVNSGSEELWKGHHWQGVRSGVLGFRNSSTGKLGTHESSAIWKAETVNYR